MGGLSNGYSKGQQLGLFQRKSAELAAIAALTPSNGQFLARRAGAWAADGILSADLTEALKTPPAIGGTTPAAGAFDALTASSYVRTPNGIGFQSLSSLGAPLNLLILDSGNNMSIANEHASGSWTGGTGGTGSARLKSNGSVRFDLDQFGRVVQTVTGGQTNSVLTLNTIQFRSTGTPAAGFGGALEFQLESSTTNDRSAARIRSLWTTATDVSRVASLILSVWNVDAEKDVLTLTKDGANIAGFANPLVWSNPVTFNPSGSLYMDTSQSAINFTFNSVTTRFGTISSQGSAGTTTNHGFNLLTNSAIRMTIAAGGGITINDAGIDADLRIEGDTDQNLFFLDASVDRIGIGTNAPQFMLDTRGNANFWLTDSGSSSAPNILTIDHSTSSTPTTNYGTTFRFLGQSSTTASQDMARIRAIWQTATHASRVSNLVLSVYNVGTETDVLTLTPTVANALVTLNADAGLNINGVAALGRSSGTLLIGNSATWSLISINSSANNTDFRIGSQVDNNLLFTDASADKVGFKTNAPTAVLDVNSDIIRLRTAKTPASASAAGNTGDIAWDANYIYVCIANATWRRVAHATW